MAAERLPGELPIDSARFSEWRAVRPFLGGVLLALGGVIIALAMIFSSEGIPARTSPVPIALIAAAVVFLCGIFALAKPGLSGLLGVAGIVSVVVTLVGTPFSAILGILLSILGGNLCYAWQPDGDTEN
jgi:hypothetical protein